MSTPIQPVNDATSTLSTIHNQQLNRDAIHLAVYQVVLGSNRTKLTPACMLQIKDDGTAVKTTDRSLASGILDPFIQDTKSLVKGDKVWLVLFPGMIKSLSHYWEHPNFPPAPTEMSFLDFKNLPKVEQKIVESNPSEYLEDIADELGMELEELLEHAHQKAHDSSYYFLGGANAEGVWLGDKFWDAYEEYTNSKVNEENRHNFISCSC